MKEIREVGKYFEREKEKQYKAQDAKDELMKKTLYSTLTKRRNERLQGSYYKEKGIINFILEGDNADDFFEDGGDDDEDRKFFGGRKQVKQERGQFQTKRPDGGFGGQRVRIK